MHCTEKSQECFFCSASLIKPTITILFFLPEMSFGRKSDASFGLKERLIKDGQCVATLCLVSMNTMHVVRGGSIIKFLRCVGETY